MKENPLFIKRQGQGIPLILLHGWGFNGEIWAPIAKQLALNWQVHQVDLPGYGNSASCSYYLPYLTEQLAYSLPKSAIWIGWSLGGLLAMAMAIWYPAHVQALILTSTSPRFTTTQDWLHAMTPPTLQQFIQQLQNDKEATLRRFTTLQVHGGTAISRQRRQLYAFLETAPQPSLETLQTSLQCLLVTDLRSHLSQINSPALLCLGSQDHLVPAEVGPACQQIWPALELTYISSAAHVPFLSHPDRFIQITQEFLSKNF